MAKRFALEGKGGLEVGQDADFTLVDLGTEEIIETESLHYRHKQTPYAGRKLRARVIRTVRRGETIFEDGRFPARTRRQIRSAARRAIERGWLTARRVLVYSNRGDRYQTLTAGNGAPGAWTRRNILTERGYKFTEVDVGEDRAAYKEMTELSDQTYVPTLVAGDEVLANFDTDQLEKFLSEHGITP